MRDNLKNTKTLVIPGNHDFIVNGYPAFKQAFMKKGDKKYFRMDNGSIHLIFLFMEWDDVEFSRSQEKWLIKQLEEIPQEETVIVLSHCYITGSGYWDSAAQKYWGDIPSVVKRLCPILEKYRVDLSLSGHNHFFEFLEKDSVDYMIIGGMGGKLDKNLEYSSPYSKWLDNDNFGWLDMKVYPAYLELTVYKDDGTVLTTKRVATK
jgi:3',5'-cyclic AMP phosphodiesterase CpdA